MIEQLSKNEVRVTEELNLCINPVIKITWTDYRKSKELRDEIIKRYNNYHKLLDGILKLDKDLWAYGTLWNKKPITKDKPLSLIKMRRELEKIIKSVGEIQRTKIDKKRLAKII